MEKAANPVASATRTCSASVGSNDGTGLSMDTCGLSWTPIFMMAEENITPGEGVYELVGSCNVVRQLCETASFQASTSSRHSWRVCTIIGMIRVKKRVT